LQGCRALVLSFHLFNGMCCIALGISLGTPERTLQGCRASSFVFPLFFQGVSLMLACLSGGKVVIGHPKHIQLDTWPLWC
jgi:hypothetical protein